MPAINLMLKGIYLPLLFFSFHVCLKCCESIKVSKSCAGCFVLDCRSLLFWLTASLLCCSCSLLCFFSLCTLNILEYTAVRKYNALSVLVKFDYLEFEFLAKLCLTAILFNKVLRSSETVNSLSERNYGTLVKNFDDLTLVD